MTDQGSRLLEGKVIATICARPDAESTFAARLVHAGAEVREIAVHDGPDADHLERSLGVEADNLEAGVDGLMVVTGIAPARPLTDLTPAEWCRRTLAGPGLVTSALRAFLPALSKRNGAVTVTTSTFAFEGWAGHGQEAALHAAGFALIKTAAEEYCEHGIRVNAVSLPMFVESSDYEAAADIAAFLFSDMAGTCNGDVFAATTEPPVAGSGR